MASLTYQTSYRRDIRLVKTWLMRGWLFILFAFLLIFPIQLNDGEIQFANGFQVFLVDSVLIAVTSAVALNILTGYGGQVSIGNAAFLAIGAMAAHIFGVRFLHLPFLVVLPLAFAVGLAVGAVVGLPSLRVRGLYLFLGTMALHFITNYVLLQYTLKSSGVSGLVFPHPDLFGIVLRTDRQWYYVFLVFAFVASMIMKNLGRHAEGRALIAVRDQDVAAMVLGVNVSRSKVTAFALSAGMLSLLGAVYAYWVGNITNDNFPLSLAIDYTVMIIIGGLGSVLGSILGAIFVSLLPTVIQTTVQNLGTTVPALSQFTGARAAIFNQMIYGLLLIGFLILKPEGLAGIWLDIKRFFTKWPYSY